MEKDEHLMLVQYHMDLYNGPLMPKNDFEVFGYAMEESPAFDIIMDRICELNTAHVRN